MTQYRRRTTGFRGRNPPASLKHRLSSILRVEPRRRFPGEKSPGLIEATGHRSGGAARRRPPGCFRGRNPPASLKPLRLRALAHGSERFRGRNPPASLKRRSARLRRSGRRRGFRGRNPPASLKRGRERGRRCRLVPRFPGEKSPGLIEARRDGPRLALWLGWFPGEKSPGLIEALPRSTRSPSSPGVSGGEIPRPH